MDEDRVKKLVRELIIEVVRIVEALQFFEQNGQVCAAGWQKGDAGMVNTAEGVATYLTENAENL